MSQLAAVALMTVAAFVGGVATILAVEFREDRWSLAAMAIAALAASVWVWTALSLAAAIMR